MSGRPLATDQGWLRMHHPAPSMDGHPQGCELRAEHEGAVLSPAPQTYLSRESSRQHYEMLEGLVNINVRQRKAVMKRAARHQRITRTGTVVATFIGKEVHHRPEEFSERPVQEAGAHKERRRPSEKIVTGSSMDWRSSQAPRRRGTHKVVRPRAQEPPRMDARRVRRRCAPS